MCGAAGHEAAILSPVRAERLQREDCASYSSAVVTKESAMQRLNVLLALFAGLMGGILSDYLLPERVQTAFPNVVAAQRFVLVDSGGHPAGVFSVGTPSGQQGTGIVLYDAQGRQIWYASGAMGRSLTIAQ
jgi:hypothetical protein